MGHPVRPRQQAIAIAQAAAKLAFVAFVVAYRFDSGTIERIGTPFACEDRIGLAERAPQAGTLQASVDEISLRPLAARLLANAKAGRLAGLPLPAIALVVGQSHRSQALQAIGDPFAGLPLAGCELGDAQPLALAVGNLADIARTIVVRDALGVLQRRSRRARRHDTRLTRHRARFRGRLLGQLQLRPGLLCRALRVLEQRGHGRRRCGRGDGRRWRGRGCRDRRRSWRLRGCHRRWSRRLVTAQLVPEIPATEDSEDDHGGNEPAPAPPRDRRQRRHQRMLVAADAAQGRWCGRCRTYLPGRQIVEAWRRKAEQSAPLIDTLRPLLGGERKRPVDRLEEGRIETVGGNRCQGPIRIGAETREGLRRRRACHRVMQHRGSGIDVAPRPLLAVEGLLLDRCVLRRHHAGQRAAADGLPGGTEIDQDGHAVAPDDDVRRLDVAVQEALGMDRGEAGQKPIAQRQHLGGRQKLPGIA